MEHSSQENRINLDNVNLTFDDISVDDGRRSNNYLGGKLFEAMENHTMFSKVKIQLHTLQAPLISQEERFLKRPPCETSIQKDYLGYEEEGHEESLLIHVQVSLPTRMHEELGR